MVWSPQQNFYWGFFLQQFWSLAFLATRRAIIPAMAIAALK